MKLRNKKTGEVMDLECITIFDRPDKYNTGDSVDEFYTIDDLNECWEDYEPKEPLIKDEKIRKAVRAWWEAVPDAITDKRILYKKNQDLAVGVYTIYCGAIYPETLEAGKFYTIAELCGEEEE